MGHVNQKGASGQKAPTAGQKVAPGAKGAAKPAQKPSAQKGQVKVTPKAASVKTGKNKKKGQRQQYDLIVTINLVSVVVANPMIANSAQRRTQVPVRLQVNANSHARSRETRTRASILTTSSGFLDRDVSSPPSGRKRRYSEITAGRSRSSPRFSLRCERTVPVWNFGA